MNFVWYRTPSLMRRVLFLFALVWSPFFCVADDDDRIIGLSADQLNERMTNESSRGRIVSYLKARLVGRGVVFDAEFGPNKTKAAWLAAYNVDARTLEKKEREYEETSFTRYLETSVLSGGRRLHTVIWWQLKSTEALQLPDGDIPVSGKADKRFKPLDDLMTNFMNKHNVAGGTLAVSRNAKMIYSRGFGYADVEEEAPMPADAKFRIASISKPITGVAVLQLVDAGKLQLTDKVLPILKQHKRLRTARVKDARWEDVTVEHLLHHRGGWDRDESPDPMFRIAETSHLLKLRRQATPAEIVRHQFSQPFDFDPGDRMAYSNFGYCVLGRVIEVVSGKAYDEYVKQSILQPAGMTKTMLAKTAESDRQEGEVRYHMQETTLHRAFWDHIRPPKRKADAVAAPYGRWSIEVMDSHGGWLSTGPDLLKFVAHLEGERPLLSSPQIKQMLLPFPGDAGKSYWYASGWNVRRKGEGEPSLDNRNFWHLGALAGTSTLLVRRYDGFAWAVLFNTDISKNGGRLSPQIDSSIHRAIRAVDWSGI